MPALIALVPFAVAALRIFLIANMLGLLLRVLVGLGLYFVVLDPVVNELVSVLQGQFGILPAPVASWVGFLNIDRFVSLVLSAFAIQQTSNFVLRINRE